MTPNSDIQPRIETLTEKKFVGIRLAMTFANNQTSELWKTFMPRRKEIENNLTTQLFSIQVYPPLHAFTVFNPDAPFEKWAAIEVSDFENIPGGMESFILQDGLYAVFHYKGLSTDNRIFQYIFGKWLPNSEEYVLGTRPHFEILGEKYKNNDPDSEEEIWIPITKRNA